MTVNPLDHPAVNGRPVTEAHAQYCRDNGHASHTVDGITSPVCPRCGDRRTGQIVVDGRLVNVHNAAPSAEAEAAHDMPLTDECSECGADLEFEQAAGWVDAMSGDDGGTYDYCPERRFAGHLPKRHELTCPAGTPGPGALPHG